MRVRPFWIEAKISGRQTELKGGTSSKDGKHEILISQRNDGEIETPFKVLQYTQEIDGKLCCITRVFYLDELIKEHVTEY